MDEAWRSAWVAALDELELTLDETERLLRGEWVGEHTTGAGWTAPSVEGPPPVDLLPRAQLLLARQHALIDETAETCADTRRQIGLLDRLADARRSPREERPVYVDVTV